MDSGSSRGNEGDKRSNDEFVLKYKKAREPLKPKVARKQPRSDEEQPKTVRLAKKMEEKWKEQQKKQEKK